MDMQTRSLHVENLNFQYIVVSWPIRARLPAKNGLVMEVECLPKSGKDQWEICTHEINSHVINSYNINFSWNQLATVRSTLMKSTLTKSTHRTYEECITNSTMHNKLNKSTCINPVWCLIAPRYSSRLMFPALKCQKRVCILFSFSLTRRLLWREVAPVL